MKKRIRVAMGFSLDPESAHAIRNLASQLNSNSSRALDQIIEEWIVYRNNPLPTTSEFNLTSLDAVEAKLERISVLYDSVFKKLN
jgi:hypothetical protein